MYILKCYFDGACEHKNPGGIVGWGWCLTDDEKEPNMCAQGCGWMEPKPENTNNYAEYFALKELLQHLIDTGDCVDADIEIMGDSQLVIRQMNGDYGINEGGYVKVAIQVRQLVTTVSKMATKVIFRWIPREENIVADILSKKGVELYNQEITKMI